MKSAAAVEDDTGRRVASALFVWMSGRLPGTVAAYLAMPDEVEVSSLFERLAGWRWALPRIEADGTLTFRDRGVPLERHRLGMDQPIDQGPEIPIHEIDTFLVPGLAFDETGARLGRGAGYFDRVLARRRGDCVAVGVTVEARIVEAIPVEPHDRKVDWLGTEVGVRECSPRN